MQDKINILLGDFHYNYQVLSRTEILKSIYASSNKWSFLILNIIFKFLSKLHCVYISTLVGRTFMWLGCVSFGSQDFWCKPYFHDEEKMLIVILVTIPQFLGPTPEMIHRRPLHSRRRRPRFKSTEASGQICRGILRRVADPWRTLWQPFPL